MDQPVPAQRFAIRRDAWVLPLLALLGGTAARSYLDVDGAEVRVRFGPLFVADIPRAEIAAARPARWPWYGGLGWRIGAGKTVALVGSTSGTVELVLAAPRQVRFCFLPLTCRRLVLSLEQPEEALAALAAPARP